MGGVSGNTSALLRWSLGEATWFLPGSLVPHGGHALTDLLLNPFQLGRLLGGGGVSWTEQRWLLCWLVLGSLFGPGVIMV